MAAKDFFHEVVKRILIQEGWLITDDPLKLSYGKADSKIDLGAEQVLGAEKEGEKIAVEIKSFSEPSFVYAFHEAIGQYINYRRGLRKQMPERGLYLAISNDIYDQFFQQEMVQDAILEENLKILIFDPSTNNSLQWIK